MSMASDDGIEREEGFSVPSEMMVPYGTCQAAIRRPDEYSASGGPRRPDDSFPRGDSFEMMRQNLEFNDPSASMAHYHREGGSSRGEHVEKEGCYVIETDEGDDDDDVHAWEKLLTDNDKGPSGTASDIKKWMPRLGRGRYPGDDDADAPVMMMLDLDDSIEIEDQPSALSPSEAGTRIFTARSIAASQLQPPQSETPPFLASSPIKQRQQRQWPFLKPGRSFYLRRGPSPVGPSALRAGGAERGATATSLPPPQFPARRASTAAAGEGGGRRGGGAGDASHRRHHRRCLSQAIPAVARYSPAAAGGRDPSPTLRRTVSFESSLVSFESSLDYSGQGRGSSSRDERQGRSSPDRFDAMSVFPLLNTGRVARRTTQEKSAISHRTALFIAEGDPAVLQVIDELVRHRSLD